MSVKGMTWVWDHSPTAGTERLVLLAVADTADDEGGNAWPAISTLSWKTGSTSAPCSASSAGS